MVSAKISVGSRPNNIVVVVVVVVVKSASIVRPDRDDRGRLTARACAAAILSFFSFSRLAAKTIGK
jgi:hypothetical protein